jgi:hypothetical protein
MKVEERAAVTANLAFVLPRARWWRKGAMEYPRRRGEPTLPDWQAAMTKDRRGTSAINQMPITSRRASSNVCGACPKPAKHSHLGRRLGEAMPLPIENLIESRLAERGCADLS